MESGREIRERRGTPSGFSSPGYQRRPTGWSEEGQKGQGKAAYPQPGWGPSLCPHLTWELPHPFRNPRPFCALCLAPRPWGPKSGKGMSEPGDGLVGNNTTILLPQDVIS